MITYWILFSCFCIGKETALYVEETFQQASQYPEIPCDLLPLSAWRNEDGDLWAVSTSAIWWHNSTSQTWQSELLPNVTSLPWRVACVFHGCHAILQTDLNFLIYHTNNHKWQEIDSGPFSTHSAVICQKEIVTVLDFQSKSIYHLKPSDGITEKASDIEEISHSSNESEERMVVWQIRDEYTYILCHSRIFKINGTHWVLLAERTNSLWPKTFSQSISWIEGNLLLMWNQGNIWAFDIDTRHWNKVQSHNERNSLSPVATWTENGKPCSLVPKDNCTSSYVPTSFWCLHSVFESNSLPAVNYSDGKSASPVTQSDIQDSHHTIQTYWHPILSPLHHGPPESSLNGSSVIWQQDHSSDFRPVIFFGTSLSIFGIVAIVWCIRRCVHFPKEALLLRDPPSVRYTAIPEAVA